MNYRYLYRRLNQLTEQASEFHVLITLSSVIIIYLIHFSVIFVDTQIWHISTLWPFKPPTHERTPHVVFCSRIGMISVLLSALTSITANRIEMLIVFPIYALFSIIVLKLRQRQLVMSTGQI